MKKTLKFLFLIVVSATIIYWLGPEPEFDQVSSDISPLQVPLDQIQSFIRQKEQRIPNIKPENESRIVWADSVRKTRYAMVYLHGFSAGVMESNPVHVNLAQKYGCNLYLARLSEHGLEGTESFAAITPVSLMNSAKEAIAVGKVIGDKVIVVSCSTGGTLSIYLAANNPEWIDAQILFSPNTAIDDPAASLLNKPWGAQLTQAVVGPYKVADPKWYGTPVEKYWTLKYRSEALIALQELLDQTMTDEVFAKLQTPYLIGYYFKNEKESDHVISVPGILNFDKQTQTPGPMKKLIAFPDVGSHVIASDLQSKDIESVFIETSSFIEDVLGLSPLVLDSLAKRE